MVLGSLITMDDSLTTFPSIEKIITPGMKGGIYRS